jgi:hypothetical protein
MSLMLSDTCRDCGQPIGFRSSQQGRTLALGGQAGATRRVAQSRQRCETCSIGRSNTNIVFCGLMLAALLSFLWYQDLTRADEGSWGAPLVVLSNLIHAEEPRPAPIAAAPRRVAPRIRFQAAPVIVEPARPVAARRRHRVFPHPPHEMDGLY